MILSTHFVPISKFIKKISEFTSSCYALYSRVKSQNIPCFTKKISKKQLTFSLKIKVCFTHLKRQIIVPQQPKVCSHCETFPFSFFSTFLDILSGDCLRKCPFYHKVLHEKCISWRSPFTRVFYQGNESKMGICFRVVGTIKKFSANFRNEYFSLKELKTGFGFFISQMVDLPQDCPLCLLNKLTQAEWAVLG